MTNDGRLSRVALLPCVVCHLLGLDQASPTEVHHLKHLPDGAKLYRGHRKADHLYTIPLCRDAHHWNGVNVNMSLRKFETLAGDEPHLWSVTNDMLATMSE